MPVAQQFGFNGVVATGWSRFSTHRLQCEPIDSALDSLINIGVILHDGHAPQGGLAACEAALDAIGEGRRFRDCKAAMQRLTLVRKSAWQECQILKELDFMRHRTAPGMVRDCLKYLPKIMEEIEEAERKVRQAFIGCIESHWIDEYLDTRLSPLRADIANLTRTWET